MEQLQDSVLTYSTKKIMKPIERKKNSTGYWTPPFWKATIIVDQCHMQFPILWASLKHAMPIKVPSRIKKMLLQMVYFKQP